MRRSAFRASVRVEDVLSIAVAIALVGYIGFRGSWRLLQQGGDNMWTVSFIALPMSLIIFLASLRYALGGEGTTISRWAGEVTTIARDWLPFLLFLLFYATFHSALWVTIQPKTFDGGLLAIDRKVFGETPSVTMERWISPPLTSAMTFCYFLHLILPPVVAALWYWRDVRMFRELLLAILICGAIGTIGYLFVPAVGPGIAYPQLYTKSLSGSLYRPLIDLMDRARAPRDVFPSLHIAIAAIVLWYSGRYGRTLGAIVAPFVVGNWISTIYLRYHYAVDDVAGFIVAVASVLLAGAALTLEERVTRGTFSDDVRDGEAGLGGHHH